MLFVLFLMVLKIASNPSHIVLSQVHILGYDLSHVKRTLIYFLLTQRGVWGTSLLGKPWKSSWEIKFMKLNHLHSSAKRQQITLVLSILSFFYTVFVLFSLFMGSTGEVFILLLFITNYLSVQLAGWRPCSTAAFSAGKPNASHPIGFITCQQKWKTQSYVTFWNDISNTQASK